MRSICHFSSSTFYSLPVFEIPFGYLSTSTDMKRELASKYKFTLPGSHLSFWHLKRVQRNISGVGWCSVSQSAAHSSLSGSSKALTLFKLSLAVTGSKHDAKCSDMIDNLFLLIPTLTCGLTIVTCDVWLTSTEKILLGCEEDTSITGFGSGSNLTPYIH